MHEAPDSDPARWAQQLGISREAVEIYLGSDVVDLHVDSFIWTRVFGYELGQRHGAGLFSARYYSQVDLPRLWEAGIGSALWSITTNPLRTKSGRARALRRNLAELRAALEAGSAKVVRNAREHREARAEGRHAAFISLQGGHALDLEPDGALADGSIVAVTLVHLLPSSVGTSSAPSFGRKRGLTQHGRELVRVLNAHRVFVDLAHTDREGFEAALEVHDRSQPLLVSHTGLSGAHPLWRNLDDRQLRAVADTGGVVGVIFHSGYLGDPYLGGSVQRVADHVVHVVKTVGSEHAALGSDWDGAIVTPRDMPTCLELPRLVDALLQRGLSADAIRNVLGASYLRALALLRG
jgi:membrane dipeptidase